MSSLELVTYRSFTSSLLALQLFPLDCQHLPLLSLFPGAHASAVRTYKEGRSRSVSVLELALDTILPLDLDLLSNLNSGLAQLPRKFSCTNLPCSAH